MAGWGPCPRAGGPGCSCTRTPPRRGRSGELLDPPQAAHLGVNVTLPWAGHPRLSRGGRGHGCYPGGLWLCSLLSMSSRRSRPQRPCEEPTCNHATIAITVYTIAPAQRQCRLLHCAPAALRCSCLSKPRTTCTARSYAGYDTANHQKLAEHLAYIIVVLQLLVGASHNTAHITKRPFWT